MTYTIPPGTPKAAKATAFGRELTKALRARDVPMKEAARAVGIGRTAIDHYRTGTVLPKTATARALADVLDWPALGRIIAEARTFVCARPGCGRTYRHEGGGPRKYCTPACVTQAQAERDASTRLRQAGQTKDGRHRAAATAQLRSAARIADERARVAEDAIAAMCRSCEPEGLCRTAECALRPLSPLPFVDGRDGVPRTNLAIRREIAARPEVRAGRSAAMRERWADPEYKARLAAVFVSSWANQTPEQRAARIEQARANYPAERRSVTSKRMHAARRERGTA